MTISESCRKGAKADIAIVNLRDITFGAVRDPIRSLMENAVSRDVRTVIVDGETLVDNYKYLRIDEARAAGQGASQRRTSLGERSQMALDGKKYR